MQLDPFQLFDGPPTGITDMYTAMGRALWFCQCFEEALAYCLCLLFDIQRGTAEEIADKVLADKRRKTLGQLVKEIADKKSPLIPELLEKRLSKFTEERNWLAHRIQYQNHTDMYHGDRFALLLKRLEAMKVEAQTLAKVFERFLDDWYRKQGLTQEELARRMKKTLLEWKTT